MGAFENQCREMSKETLIEMLRSTMDDKRQLVEFVKERAEELADKCSDECDCWACDFYDSTQEVLEKVKAQR